MSGYKFPVILFFIESMVPTEDESAAARELGMVRFRNVSAMSANDRAERDVDGVAGLIPKQYENHTVVASLADVGAIMQKKIEEDRANAAALSANPGVEIVAEKGKGKKEKAAAALPKEGWQANA